jgi:molybdopterin molybdotransferase
MPESPRSGVLRNISVAEAIACFGRIKAVAPRRASVAEAIGLRLAEDVMARRSHPLEPKAARNGYAVVAASTIGASQRRPRLLGPEVHPLDTGMTLPAGTDAVLPFGQAVERPKGLAAIKPLAAGDGVTAADSITGTNMVIAKAGNRLTLAAALAIAACGVTEVLVRRPVVDIVFNAPGMASPGEQFIGLACSAIRGSGCEIGSLAFAGGDGEILRAALLASSADIITIIGGTGDGQGDTTMQVLAETGEAVFHGVRLSPGGTIGFGFVDGKPVFASPGRLPDMITANIVLSWHFARRAFGRPPMEPQLFSAPLTEAIPASPGRSRLVLARFENGVVTPLLDDEPSIRDIAQANVSIFVPEGAPRRRKGQMAPLLRMSVTM